MAAHPAKVSLSRAMAILERTFDAADIDNVGCLTSERWSQYLTQHGFREVEKMESLFEEFDVDKSGDISFKEYLQIVYYWAEISDYSNLFSDDDAACVEPVFSLLRQFFEAHDRDGRRTISKTDVIEFCTVHLSGLPVKFDELWASVSHAAHPNVLSVSRFLLLVYMASYPTGSHCTTTGTEARAGGGAAADATLVPLHQHPLKLQPCPYPQGRWQCFACGLTSGAETNHCALCYFDLCEPCLQKSRSTLTMADSLSATGMQSSELWRMLYRMYRVLEADFASYDTDNDASIDESELLRGVRNSVDVVNVVGRIQRVFAKVDTDGNGTLDFIEFLHFVYSLVRRSSYSDVVARTANAGFVIEGMRWLRQAYERIDEDNNKRLDRSEVEQFLTQYCGELPPSFGEVFERLQDPTRHVLDFVDFLHLLYEIVTPAGRYGGLARRSRRTKKASTALLDTADTTKPTARARLQRLGTINMDELVLGDILGEGSFGKVYKADLRGVTVAAKFLTERYSAAVQADFDKECAIMARVDHPNIIFLIGAASIPPNLCMVTELAANGSLFDIIQKQRAKFSPALTHSVLIDIAEGVHALHSMDPPILHRDLKSLNVLLDENYRAIICDFGLSKFKEASIQSNKSPIGTPQWMAPEVMQSPTYGLEADVYSFAMIVWEITHGAVPFSDVRHPFQIMMAVAKGERPHVSSKCPKYLATLMRRCWAQKPKDRPTFRDVLEYLKAQDPTAAPAAE
eukprot:Amastigsp_a508342_82.p1 type:complete len:742 gc:universal Amastigsp_a508342_82:35-2260(+)